MVRLNKAGVSWLGVVQRSVYRRLSPKSVVTVDLLKLTLALKIRKRKKKRGSSAGLGRTYPR